METIQISKAQLLAGRVMSGLVIFFMAFDAVMKFICPPEVIDTTVNQLGYQEHHILTMGIIALLCTILYALPATSILGAVLLTGYFGGAVATHLRVDNPLLGYTLFSIYIGILMWGALWLREPRLRALIPFKK